MDTHSRNTTTLPRARLAPALLVALALAGCGGGGPKAGGPKIQADRYVFSSAKDCAESGKLTLQRCGELIDAAVAQHVASAPTFTSLRACETSEGGDRCERIEPKVFKPRLVAFLVTITPDQAVAAPLYAPAGGELGLRGLDKKAFVLMTDDTVTYSRSAVAAYEANKGDGKVISAPVKGL